MAHPVGYSGTPLPQKLGIKPGHRVVLVDAPADLELDLPEGVVVDVRPSLPPYDVGVLFCGDRSALVEGWGELHAAVTPAGRLWVAWPKRSSGVPTDLDEHFVREHGLTRGRVDMKVCAIDATWTGFAFVVRLKDR